jgi:O-antigen/teichoic acid export membrane protein
MMAIFELMSMSKANAAITALQSIGADGRKAGLAFSALAAGAALGFVCNLLWARFLGPAGIGAIFLGITIVAIGATLGRAGIDNVALREASIRYRDGDTAALVALNRRARSTVLGCCIAVSMAIWLVASSLPMSDDIRSLLGPALPVLLIGLPASALLILQGEFLKACGAPALGTFLQVAFMPVLVILGLLGASLVTSVTVIVAAWVQTVATILAAATATATWLRRYGMAEEPDSYWNTPRLFRAGMPFLSIAGTSLFLTWTDLVVLGAWSDSATVGVYGVATRIISLMTFILIAANSVTAPKFATLAGRSDHSQLQSVAQTSTFWMTAVATPLTLLLMLWPEMVLGLFGPGFATGAMPLRILAAGQFVNVATGSVGFLLMMTGHERILRNVMLVAAVANLIGNLVLVPEFGAEGAAVATALSVAILNIAAYWQVRRRLQINTLGYLAGIWRTWIR